MALSETGQLAMLAVARTKGRTLPPNNDTDNPQDVAWLTAFRLARDTINVASPNINDDAFRQAVVEAVGRGVHVNLITGIGFNHFETNLPFQGATTKR